MAIFMFLASPWLGSGSYLDPAVVCETLKTENLDEYLSFLLASPINRDLA